MSTGWDLTPSPLPLPAVTITEQWSEQKKLTLWIKLRGKVRNANICNIGKIWPIFSKDLKNQLEKKKYKSGKIINRQFSKKLKKDENKMSQIL